ncbi:hypothetical protein TrST_g2600 [Triparma strigata]|uniref:MHD domain-containing protein n=1 Tax=Triparma strigata TaxID=1606541 RepID=A0A9W7AKF8_9STRA|nr:hypothetical protein TrST_g2600 [Triparma strigata]
MITSLFILSLGGEVLIERHLRPSSSGRAAADFFWSKCQSGIKGESTVDSSAETYKNIPPILLFSNQYIISVFRSSLIFLCTLKTEHPPLLCIEFLHRLASTFEEYFGKPIDEELVKENFSTIYMLLEEMNDYGNPLTTEPNALQSLITPPTLLSKITQTLTGSASHPQNLDSGTTSNMPWRRSNVSHPTNEIYVDLVEEIDCILTSSGTVISSDINGSIQCVSKLSGVPDLTLTFKDSSVIDDCCFHPCIRYGRYDEEKVISFVPPDGAFELMRYRVKNLSGRFMPPIFCEPKLMFGEGEKEKGRIDIRVGMKEVSSLIFPREKGMMVLEDVVVTVTFPRVVRTANLTATGGTVLYDEAKKVAKWHIPKIDSKKTVQLTGTMAVKGHRPEESPPIQLEWKIPMASISGLAVSGLSVVNEAYKPYKGVRTITKSGKFTVRCG